MQESLLYNLVCNGNRLAMSKGKLKLAKIHSVYPETLMPLLCTDWNTLRYTGAAEQSKVQNNKQSVLYLDKSEINTKEKNKNI